jgi:hypothetical protein
VGVSIFLLEAVSGIEILSERPEFKRSKPEIYLIDV